MGVPGSNSEASTKANNGRKNLTTILRHPLFRTLRELKGNPRATVLTEPMFGIPWNLFSPCKRSGGDSPLSSRELLAFL